MEHNLELLRRLDEIVAIGRPVVIGTSRKSFLGKLAGGRDEDERLPGTIATNVLALERGASVFRVHDVAQSWMPWRWPLLRSGHDVGERADDEFDDELDDDDLDEDDRGAGSPAVTIEISGLSLYTHHGVGEAERELGQRLVFDIAFELDECDATVTDRIEDTVNYAEVCEQVALGAQERSYKTLERLCTAVADRLIDRFGAESVRVKATKPEPPIPLPVDEVSVEVWKEALTVGYLGLGSNEGDRLANLRAARDALGAARRGGDGLVVGVRDRAAGGGHRPAGLPQRLPADPDRARSGGAARRLQGGRARARARRREACATGRARSTWTCCCSATSSFAPSASRSRTPRSRAGASCSSRCSSSTPELDAARRHAARGRARPRCATSRCAGGSL